VICQGKKSIYCKKRKGDYLFLNMGPSKTKEEPTVPSTLVDRLKQMDPKALAAILLE